MMRKILGTLGGVAVANLWIFVWEYLITILYPDAMDLAAAQQFALVPTGAKLMVVTGWFFGALIGALVAFVAARWDAAGWIVGALVAAAGIANVIMLDHPLWMQLCAVALPFIGALFAFGLYRRWSVTSARARP